MYLIGRVNTNFTLVIWGIFVLQVAIGAALDHGPARGGHDPAHAHQGVWFALVGVQGLAAIGASCRPATHGRHAGCDRRRLGLPRRADPVDNGLKLKLSRHWTVESMDLEARSVSSYNLKV